MKKEAQLAKNFTNNAAEEKSDADQERYRAFADSIQEVMGKHGSKLQYAVHWKYTKSPEHQKGSSISAK